MAAFISFPIALIAMSCNAVVMTNDTKSYYRLFDGILQISDDQGKSWSDVLLQDDKFQELMSYAKYSVVDKGFWLIETIENIYTSCDELEVKYKIQ